MNQDNSLIKAFALVGAAREDYGSLKLPQLAEHVAQALASREWIRLGFYDEGYAQSVHFWPKGVEDEEGCRRTSMSVFSGEIGAPSVEPKFPACLVISEHEGKTEAVITWSIASLRDESTGDSR